MEKLIWEIGRQQLDTFIQKKNSVLLKVLYER